MRTMQLSWKTLSFKIAAFFPLRVVRRSYIDWALIIRHILRLKEQTKGPFLSNQDFSFFQTSDRIITLLTLGLISMTIYVSLEAPSQRGMSYVEIWIIGMQIPMLITIIENGCIMIIMKKKENKISDLKNQETDWLRLFQKLDIIVALVLLVYFFVFQVVFWSFA